MSESSNDPLALEDYYRFFSRWENAYPGGIPESCIVTGEQSPVVFRVVFIGMEKQLGSEERELLDAAIEKGLRWPRSECDVVALSSSASEEQLQKAFAMVERSQAVVLLGDVPSELEELLKDSEGTHRCVTTVSLDRVLKDKTMKRRFWEDLKKLRT